MTDIAALGLKIEYQEVDKGTESLNRFSKSAGEAERSSGRFGRGAKQANTEAANTADKAAKSYGGINKAVLTAARSILVFSGAAIGIAASSRTLANFDQSMSSVQAVTRATASEMTAMRDMAKELGATTEFSASQAADGLKFLGMAGFSASESIAAIPAVLDLATAASMGLSEAADTASNIMSGFGIAATEAANVADVLAAAATRSNTTVAQLGGAMSTVAPIASALDISLADTAASIGLLSDAGIQGERAGTALRGVLAALAGPTSDAQKVLAKLGLTVEDVNPKTNDLSEIFGRLKDANLSTADAMRIFGREAASGALVLVEANAQLGEFGELLTDVEGEAARVADTMRDNLAGDLLGVASAAEGLIIAMGEAGLVSVMRFAAQSSTELLRGITSLINKAQEAGAVISSMLQPAIDALSPVFSVIANNADIAVAALSGFYAPVLLGGIALLTKALAVGLVGAIKAVTAAMLANPIGAITAAIVAAGYAAWKFRDDIAQIFGVDVGELAKTGANYLIGSFVAAWEAIKFTWDNFGNMLGGAVVGGVNAAINAINSLIEFSLSGVNTFAQRVSSLIPGLELGQIGGSIRLPTLENTYAEQLAGNYSDYAAKAGAAFSKDWIGAASHQLKLAKADRVLADLSADLYERDPYANVTEGAKELANATNDATEETKNLSTALGGAGQQANQNIQTIRQLEQQLYLAGLRGEELAVAQARLSLNEYATEGQIARVTQLAQAIFKVQEQMRARDRFGDNAKDAEKYITGNTSPLSGGQFDDQFARYEAEAEAEALRYQEAQARLVEARELQIETERTYDEIEYEMAQQHAARMQQIDDAKQSLMLDRVGETFSSVTGIMKSAFGEQSGIYRAMFAAEKAYAIAKILINAPKTASDAYQAMAGIPVIGPALGVAAAAAALGYQVAQVASAKSVNISGMAHDGIDSVPETGTWLLEKGERVTTAQTSAKMDNVLQRIDSQMRGNAQSATLTAQPEVVVNVHNAPEGTRIEESRNDEQFVIDVILEDLNTDGRISRYGERRLGWGRQGT